MFNLCWDMDVSPRDFKKVLKNPRDKRFPDFFARLLSYAPFFHVFHRYITPAQFKKHFPKVRPLVDADLIGAGRLEFWDWLYKRLK